MELSWEENLLIFPSEKDRMYRVLGRISRFQREHGLVQVKSRWAYAKRLNTELEGRSQGQLQGYMEENHADVNVLSIWRQKERYLGERTEAASVEEKDIQKRCEHQAHRRGMRISRICAEYQQACL